MSNPNFGPNGPVHGIWTTAEILSIYTRTELQRLLETGQLRRLRRGRYADQRATPQAIRAVTLGGVLTCFSALNESWVPHRHQLHVRIPANSNRAITSPAGAVIHRATRGISTDATVDSIPVSLAMALQCTTDLEWIAMVDSILHERLADRSSLAADVLMAAPIWHRRVHDLMTKVDPRSESGTESILRCALRAEGYRVRIQVQIGQDRVDMLVGDRLVLECDSLTHHWNSRAFEHDRRRDLRLKSAGYEVLRFTYNQLMYELDEVLEMVRRMTRARKHRWSHRDRRVA